MAGAYDFSWFGLCPRIIALRGPPPRRRQIRSLQLASPTKLSRYLKTLRAKGWLLEHPQTWPQPRMHKTGIGQTEALVDAPRLAGGLAVSWVQRLARSAAGGRRGAAPDVEPPRALLVAAISTAAGG